MDIKLNQDITRFLSAAHKAIPVLRHNAEQLETVGQDSTAERDAVRQLNMYKPTVALMTWSMKRAGFRRYRKEAAGLRPLWERRCFRER